jgi:hypothetical protein
MKKNNFIWENSFYIRFYKKNTFISSILYIFDDLFKLSNNNDVDVIKYTKTQLLNDFSQYWPRYKKYRKYKKDIIENNLLNPDSNIDISDETKKYICDYFEINIITFNEHGICTGAYYTGAEYNKDIVTLFFLETLIKKYIYYSPILIDDIGYHKFEQSLKIQTLYEKHFKNYKKSSKTFTKIII